MREDFRPIPFPVLATQTVFWIVLYSMAAGNALSLYRGIDADAWWHLRTGQWIVEHGAVPQTDPFARLGRDTGAPWLAYSWLFELLTWGLVRTLGLAGLALYRVVLVLAVVVSLHRLACRRPMPFFVVAPLLFLAVYSLCPMFTERPWLFSLLFFTWTLDAVLGLREGSSSRWAWLLPVIFCLWANLHIQFIYGLFVLGLACLSPGAGSRWRLVLLTGACFLATLINPYHVRLWGVVFEYATQTAAFRHVQELTPLSFREPSDYTVVLLAGLAVFALGKRSHLSAFEVLLLAGMGFLALHARRDIGFLCIACVGLGTRTDIPEEERSEPERVPLVIAGLWVVSLVIAFWVALVREERLQDTVRKQYPEAAVAYVREQGLTGPLFNDFDWGGYLTWALPEMPVAVDGRTNLYGDERLERAFATQDGRPGWNKNPELETARVVLIQKALPLAELLALDPHWQRIHDDEIAVVFVPAGKR
jgi:hypothetical protein